MGSPNLIRFIAIISVLAVTSFAVMLFPERIIPQRNNSLAEVILPTLDTWPKQRHIDLSDKIIQALELDDYLNTSFTNGEDIVSLYVGYYLSQKKIGAAHSPLVCFSGQGWTMSNIDDFSMRVGSDRINLSEMIITKDGQRQLVLYWFQAYNKTSPGTFMQKINLLRAKLLYTREDNAFIRVMIPITEDTNLPEAKKIGTQFINQFYPILKKYITINEAPISSL